MDSTGVEHFGTRRQRRARGSARFIRNANSASATRIRLFCSLKLTGLSALAPVDDAIGEQATGERAIDADVLLADEAGRGDLPADDRLARQSGERALDRVAVARGSPGGTGAGSSRKPRAGGQWRHREERRPRQRP